MNQDRIPPPSPFGSIQLGQSLRVQNLVVGIECVNIVQRGTDPTAHRTAGNTSPVTSFRLDQATNASGSACARPRGRTHAVCLSLPKNVAPRFTFEETVSFQLRHTTTTLRTSTNLQNAWDTTGLTPYVSGLRGVTLEAQQAKPSKLSQAS